MTELLSAPVEVYIGLGSNLQQPLTQVTAAVASLAQLPHTQLLKCSRWYQSKPLVVAGENPDEHPDFVNGAVCLLTRLDAHDLLDQLQAIEHAQGRERKQHWGDRTLDLDLLLYGNHIINSERLQVPHPQLHLRNFVLYPLADLNPALTLPTGTSLASLLASNNSDGLFAISEQPRES